MTDSKTATERLREMLDARGVEWTEGDASHTTEWTNASGQHCSAMYWKPMLTVLISKCTPEQAIAATLVSSACAFAKPTDLTDGCAALERIAELEAEVERLRRAGYEVGYHDAMKALGSGECEIAMARLVDVAAKVDIDSCAEILECVEAIRKAVKR